MTPTTDYAAGFAAGQEAMLKAVTAALGDPAITNYPDGADASWTVWRQNIAANLRALPIQPAPSGPVGGWRGMESAPRATTLLLWIGEWVIGFRGEGHWFCIEGNHVREITPTAWAPLPPPPQGE